MKLVIKIIVCCIIIFGITVFITKKTIDYTFQKLQCEHVEETSSTEILFKTIEV